MRFIHTADLHIGANRYLPGYLLRQEEMLDSIFDVAFERGIETVVIAGDIFDDPETTTQLEREMVERKLLEYDAAGFKILAIPGNHDLVDATGYTALHYLAMLSAHGKLKNSHVVESTAYVPVGDTIFCLLCHRKNKFQEDLKAAVRELHDSSLLLPQSTLVVVAHETIRGSQTDVKMEDGSYYKLKDGEEAPDESLPVTYWALGDIHKVQSVSRNAFYSGSPLQTKFNDTWPKGLLVVDTASPEDPEFVALHSTRFVELGKDDPCPPDAFVKWKVSSKDDLPENIPQNVVKISIGAEDRTLSLDVEGSLGAKLLEGVKQQGATAEELALAQAEINSLLEFSLLSEASDG